MNILTREQLLQAAKPILFNTPMVQAIDRGDKTATRRVMKPQPTERLTCGKHWRELLAEAAAPYQSGDILYVRETWCWCPCWDCGMNTEKGCCDVIANRFYNNQRKETGCYGYRASFETGELPFDNWHPSIHMPQKAARLFLRVTGVMVQRLQDILKRPGEVAKEGIPYADEGDIEASGLRFKELWNSTIKPANLPTYGWDANPWVWVIGFEQIEVK